MIRKKYILVISILILYLNVSFSQDFFTESEIPPKKAVQIINDKIYFIYRNSFIIGKLTNPLHYNEIGKVKFGAKIYSVKVVGNYAYIAFGEKGFQILNIKNKNNPRVISKVTSVRVFDIDVSRGYAYIAGGVEGLSIYDVRNPLKPKKLGYLIQWSDIYNIFVQGKFVYASSPDDGIHIIDVFNPIDPIQVSKIETGSDKASVIKIEGNSAFIAGREEGLYIYDISLPKEPKKVTKFDFGRNANDIFVLGRTVYATDGESGFSIINTRNPSKPKFGKFYNVENRDGSIFVVNNFAYIADGFNKVKVIQLEDSEEVSSVKTDEKISKEDIEIENILNVEDDAEIESVEGLAKNWRDARKYAVVIGISKYKSPDIPDLSFANNDALEFYKFLQSKKGGGFRKENIILLLDENATTQKIREALFYFLKRPKIDDFIYIYFSGHGACELQNPNNMYLITYDTDLSKVSSTAFPMWDIQTSLERHIKTNSVIIIADACHSGGIGIEIENSKFKKQNMINRHIMELSKTRPGRVSLTASESGELSYESESWGGGHGVFTYFLLKGLDGKADNNGDKFVSLGEVVEYTFENVIKATKNKQHPDIAGRFNINIPLVILK